MAKPSKDDIVAAFCGINSRTLEVDTVFLSRGQTLSSGSHSEYLLPGRRADAEVTIKFGLTDLIYLAEHQVGTQTHTDALDELERKVEALRKET